MARARAEAASLRSTRGADGLDDDLRAVEDIFDAEFYASVYADCSTSGMSPWRHYCKIGHRQGRKPTALLDPEWYLSAYPEVPPDEHPVIHYLRTGGFEGKNPIPEFDSAWYLASNPDVASRGMNPLVHFVQFGAGEGRSPSRQFDTVRYLEAYTTVRDSGMNPLAHYVQFGIDEGLRTFADSDEARHAEHLDVRDLIVRRWSSLAPLRVREATSEGPHISVVTDSVGPSSLFGGVGTALVLGALWADRAGRPLRVVTRTEPGDASRVREVLAANGVTSRVPVRVAHVAEARGDALELHPLDAFLTTSWWTTASTRASVPDAKIVYLLQEDEREFYPSGDERMRAEEVMTAGSIVRVVNTAGLHAHLREGRDPGEWANSISFEPAFGRGAEPKPLRQRPDETDFFFYARPGNPRNLFYLGIEALDLAVEKGLLGGRAGRVHLVGREIPRLTFCDGSSPLYHEGLPWSRYQELLRIMTAGLSLMATPHPSYPPLDLAALGIPVVTNTWPGKPDLSGYSDTIVMAEPDPLSIVEGIEVALNLSAARGDRPAAGLRSPYNATWQENLGPVLDFLERVSPHV